MQQKTIPNYATHGNTYNSSILKPTGASHSHLHKPNEKKEKRTSLRASSLGVTAPELVPRACTCRRPARSDGVVAKGRALRPVRAVSGPRADRLGTWLALPRSSTTAGTRMRRLGAPKPTREPKTSARPKEAGQASPRKEEKKSTRARQNSKSRRRAQKRAPAERRPA